MKKHKLPPFRKVITMRMDTPQDKEIFFKVFAEFTNVFIDINKTDDNDKLFLLKTDGFIDSYLKLKRRDPEEYKWVSGEKFDEKIINQIKNEFKTFESSLSDEYRLLLEVWE